MIAAAELPDAVLAVVAYIEQASGIVATGAAVPPLPSAVQQLVGPVGQMMLAVPSQADNAAGVAARAALVSNLESMVPGSDQVLTSGFCTKTKSFFSIFFPSWSARAYQPSVATRFPQSSSWWNGFATAALCQSMYYLTRDLKPQLLQDDIHAAVTDANSQMFDEHGSGAQWYSYVYSVADPAFATALSQVQGRLADALQLYQATLCSSTWQQYYLGVLASGNLVLDWYWYHHFIKQLALTASVANVSALAAALPKSLQIPQSVSSQKWTTYNFWIRSGTRTAIDHNDIDADARAQILAKVSIPSSSGQAYASEGYSFDFTANKMPGSKYRQVPSSCFAAGTQVRMADGTLRAIEQVRPGDLVATPNGARRVGYVAMPLRGGRDLYRFEDSALRFADSHPFAHPAAGQGGPALVSAARERLAANVPTLGSVGLAQLARGVGLVVEGQAGAVPAPGLVRERAGDQVLADQVLYDLVLETQGDELSLYYAGDGERRYLVASEIPIILREPWAAIAIIQALRLVAPRLAAALPTTDRTVAAAELWRRLWPAVDDFLLHVTAGLDAATATADAPELSLTELPAAVRATMVHLATAASAGDYNWRLGWLLECLLLWHGEQAAAAIDRGWRQIPGLGGRAEDRRVVAVSLHEVTLFAEHPAAGATKLELHLSLLDATCGARLGQGFAVAPARAAYAYSASDCYLPVSGDVKGPALDLHIEVTAETTAGIAPLTTAQLHFPPDCPDSGVRRGAELIRDVAGASVGRVTLDVRLLTQAQADKERAAAAGWNDAAKQAFANRFGRAWGMQLLRQLDPGTEFPRR